MKLTRKALAIFNDGSIVPASPLDNILCFKDKQVDYSLHSFYDGAKISTQEDKEYFYQKVKKNILDKKYPTTDHLMLSIKVGSHNLCYVSLDNSVRSNSNKCPIKIDYPNYAKRLME